jgi:hypothetical protein
MSWRRVLIMISVICAVAGGSVLLLSSHGGSGGTAGIREAWLGGDYSQAHALLDGVERRLHSADARLLRAYILRGEGELERSDRQLILALQVATEKEKSHQWEIHLGLALNALHRGNLQHARNAWAAAQVIDAEHPYTLFLAGVIAYSEEEYGAAAAILKQPLEQQGAPWLGETLRRRYPEGWRARALARCAIEEGEPFRARRILERTGEHRKPEGAALAVYSFLKEAEGQPLALAAETHRAAHAYLKRLPNMTCGPQPLINAIVWQRIDQLKPEVDRAVLVDTAALCAALLERWGGPSDLRTLATLLFTRFAADLSAESWATTAAILAELQQATSAPLAAEAEERLHAAIWTGDAEQVPYLTKVAERLLSHSPADGALDGLQERIVALLPSDDATLAHARRLLRTWNTLFPTSMRRYQFAHRLLTESNDLWEDPEGRGEQAHALVQLAAQLPIPEDQKSFCERVIATLRHSYERAHRANNLEALYLLHQAARQFGVDHLGPDREREVANQLADAIHYFEAGRAHEAHRRAKWVLQLDPQNGEAHQIVGLLSFVQGNQEKALRHLRFVQQLNSEATEALGICEIELGHPERGEALLQGLARRARPLSDHAYLLLGYRALEAQLPEEAALWLGRIGRLDAEGAALLALVAYQQNDPQRALAYLDRCPLQAFGLTALRGACCTALDQPYEVELSACSDALPPNLQVFLNEEFGESPLLASASLPDYEPYLNAIPGLLK